MASNFFAIGLMSGTSMDSVDAALIETDGKDFVRFIDSFEISYDESFKKSLKEVEAIISSQEGVFKKDQQLKNEPKTIDDILLESTNYHLMAIEGLLKRQKVMTESFIIGYHGQTFYHQPLKKVSVILGYPKILSDYFKQPVVFNFRENDILNGGRGAPLAPIYHYTLAKMDNFIPSVIANCGGISNITFISSCNMLDVVAFDVGPGNTLLDRFITIKTEGRYSFDENGYFSSKGIVDKSVMDILWKKSLKDEAFYLNAPPKSLDVNDFILPDEVLKLSVYDGAKTLAAFTADVLARSVLLLKPYPKIFIGGGGGFFNPTIMNELKIRLIDRIPVFTADEVKWRTKSLEAELFAYLAVRSSLKLPLSFPNTTGVPYPLGGGDLYSSRIEMDRNTVC
ncbi:MAG: anhydro-N-acetylmuramic acid kinase [Proteobacteria bacterium]|nr:anhydro-N-acetylmuramic acid kinase [Pseudomonadota bacterium]